MSRKISLPKSAQECADSATIDADPVISAAMVFAIAMTRLALSAITTVSDRPAAEFGADAVIGSVWHVA